MCEESSEGISPLGDRDKAAAASSGCTCMTGSYRTYRYASASKGDSPLLIICCEAAHLPCLVFGSPGTSSQEAQSPHPIPENRPKTEGTA